MKKIDEILNNPTGATSKTNLPTSPSTDPAPASPYPGDPNCPVCGGIGFVDPGYPLGDPNFGRIEICQCRKVEVSQAAQDRLYRLSNLDAFQNMTFDTFKTQGRMGLGDQQVRSLENAYNQSRHYAQTLNGWLMLMGEYGCGKTHLAAAIANAVVDLGIPTLFLTVPDLLDWLRFSYDSPDTSYESRFEEIKNIKLLVLDDLGTQNATPWAQEKLFQIINYRYIHKLPTVVTTNLELKDMDGRIASRLQDPEVVLALKIHAPDFRTPVRDDSPDQISALALLYDRTFGNFSLRDHEKLPPEDLRTLSKAFRAAQEFAEEPHGWLVLMGGYACGKTHLAAAIGNYRRAAGEEPIFVVVPDLLDHLRSTFSPSSNVPYDRRFNEVRYAPLLILDDLGTQSATPWAREKLYQLFNFRYNAKLPTVITTSSKLEEIDPRIRSRMLDSNLCTVHIVAVPPFRSGAPAARKPRNGGS
jgi:DNA replication protein DnaC